MAITVKDIGADNKNEIYTPFDRVYLEYGPQDAFQEVDKTSKGKVIGKRMTPKEDKSVHSPQELLQGAIENLSAMFPGQDAIVKLLSLASDQLAIVLRNKAVLAEAPPAPVNVAASQLKSAKEFVKCGVVLPNKPGKCTLESALEYLKSLPTE